MGNLPLTKSKHLLPFAAALKEQGIPVKRLLNAASLPRNCLDDPDTLIPAVHLGYFRKLVAQETGRPALALQSSLYAPFGKMGDFGQALRSEPTLLASIKRFQKLVSTETSNVIIDLYPLPGGDLWFGHRLLSQNKPGAWHSNLYIIGSMLQVVRLADPAWSPTEIMLRSRFSREHSAIIEELGAKALLEKSGNGFNLPVSMLALPVSKNWPQGENKDTITATDLTEESYAESIRHVVRFYAGYRWLNIDEISEVIDQSVRSIQRRLSMEQTTYSDLVQQCRLEMASDLLDCSDATMANIAYQLGYNNQSSFTRAFYRWAGLSPVKYRQYRRQFRK